MSQQNLAFASGLVGQLQQGERRAWVRYPSQLNSTCQRLPAKGEESWPARIQNVSVSGLGLITNRCFTVGTELAVDIMDAEGKQSQTVRARVEHTTTWAEGSWLLGCSFVE